jgi:hypothetical protein
MEIRNVIENSQIIAEVEALTLFFYIEAKEDENHPFRARSKIRITARIEETSVYSSPSQLTIDIENIKEREEWHRAFHAKKRVVGSFEHVKENEYENEHYHLYLPVCNQKNFDEILEIYKSAYYIKAKTTVVFSVIDTKEVPFNEGGTTFERVPIKGEKFGVVEFSIRSTSPF